jgi:DNA-binding CsgD family transcriptional regulator
MATATFLDIELCATYLITGDDERSIAHGRAATERARDLGQLHAAAAALQLLATTYLVAGDRTAASEAAQLARRLDDDEILDALLRVGVDGIGALLDEDRRAATAAFDAAMKGLRAGAASPPASWKGLWPLLLAVERRDEDAADAIVEVIESGATVNRLNLGYLDYARAVLSGRRAPDEAPTLVADGDQHLQHGPFWHQLGRRLVAEAAIADSWGDPVTWAREAGVYFDGRGHGPIATACVALAVPAATMVRSAWAFAGFGVTRREADVLVLVREGLTNKEIAERLYLSPRTVEKHIESLLRKTTARSRTQLAMLADQSDSGAP